MIRENVSTYRRDNARLYGVFGVFALMFFALFSGLFYRQIYLYDDYAKAGRQQSQRRIIKPGARGDIYDRKGRLIVGNKPVFSAVIYAHQVRPEFYREYMRIKRKTIERGGKVLPKEISHQARLNVLQRHVDEINRILKSDYAFDLDRFNDMWYASPLLPIPLIENLSMREHAILAEKLDVNSSVQILTDTARYYPYGRLAAHAIGYVRSEKDPNAGDEELGLGLFTFSHRASIGKSGLEEAFDETLSGTMGVEIWTVDKNGNKYECLENRSPKKGDSLICSLDMDLQGAAEDAFGERKGAAVVLDVNSGEVLTMLSKPGYDPNDLSPRITSKVASDISARGAWINRATQGLYPPGSTFKIITSIAGAKSGKIDLESISECTGSYKVGNRKFPCHRRYGHGYVNLVDAIAQSCNVFFYEHGVQMGINPIHDTAVMFGLDSDTGIELNQNSWRRTIVPNAEFKKLKRRYEGPWTAGDTANTSIGQGYLIQTPLHMACFTASFARGETRTRPSLIHDAARICDSEYHGASDIGISREMYGAIVRGMVKSVEEGTSRRAKVEGLSMAAKSGTAQIRAEGKALTLAWMIAFAPVENPQIAAAVVVEGEEPGDASGGATAGPIIKAIFQKYKEQYVDKGGAANF